MQRTAKYRMYTKGLNTWEKLSKKDERTEIYLKTSSDKCKVTKGPTFQLVSLLD